MTIRKIARARKTILAVASVSLFASAFQAGGCTINVDQDLLNTISGMLENAGGLSMGPGNGPHGMGGMHHGPGSGSHTGDQGDPPEMGDGGMNDN